MRTVSSLLTGVDIDSRALGHAIKPIDDPIGNACAVPRKRYTAESLCRSAGVLHTFQFETIQVSKWRADVDF
ncbi:hypothetical protein L1887_32632 [Cichorium endivia]|nr:hypothetical protein L1887_32632 [Cichorium endivia]